MTINFNSYWNKAINNNNSVESKKADFNARQNLGKIAQLADESFKNYKLLFDGEGKIDLEYGGLLRIGTGLVRKGIQTLSNFPVYEKEIGCLESFIKYLNTKFQADDNDEKLLQNAIDGLFHLYQTYENKPQNFNIIGTAIQSLTSIRQTFIQEKAKKQASIQNLKNFLNPQNSTQNDYLNAFIGCFNAEEIDTFCTDPKYANLTFEIIRVFLKNFNPKNDSPIAYLQKIYDSSLKSQADFDKLGVATNQLIDNLPIKEFGKTLKDTKQIAKLAASIGNLPLSKGNRRRAIKSAILDIISSIPHKPDFPSSDKTIYKKIDTFAKEYTVTVFPSKECLVRVPFSFVNKGGIKRIYFAVKLPDDETAEHTLIMRARVNKDIRDNLNNREKINDGKAISERCKNSVYRDYIVKIYGVDDQRLETYMEIYPHGDLESLIKSRSEIFKNLKNILISCAKGVMALHENNFTHNDIKLENFLVTKKRDIPVVLGDFDFANDWETSFDPWHLNGSPLYYSPEKFMLRNEKISYQGRPFNLHQINNLPIQRVAKAIDIYALGTVFYEILTGNSLPWCQNIQYVDEIENQMKKFMNNPTLFLNQFPEPADKSSIMHLIWKMVHPKVEMRPSVEEVINGLASMAEDGMQNEMLGIIQEKINQKQMHPQLLQNLQKEHQELQQLQQQLQQQQMNP